MATSLGSLGCHTEGHIRERQGARAPGSGTWLVPTWGRKPQCGVEPCSQAGGETAVTDPERTATTEDLTQP